MPYQAIIETRNAQYFIEDRRSKNGTYIGERRLVEGESVQLKSGDSIRFGEVELMFFLVGYIPVGETVFLNPSTIAPLPSTGSDPTYDNTPSSEGPALPTLVAINALQENKTQVQPESQETHDIPSRIDDPGALGPSVSLLPSIDTEEQQPSAKNLRPARHEAPDQADSSRAVDSFR